MVEGFSESPRDFSWQGSCEVNSSTSQSPDGKSGPQGRVVQALGTQGAAGWNKIHFPRGKKPECPGENTCVLQTPRILELRGKAVGPVKGDSGVDLEAHSDAPGLF